MPFLKYLRISDTSFEKEKEKEKELQKLIFENPLKSIPNIILWKQVPNEANVGWGWGVGWLSERGVVLAREEEGQGF